MQYTFLVGNKMIKPELKYKLKNCLETILEFENYLYYINDEYDMKMNREFRYISDVLENIDDLEFSVEDLNKIEEITTRFLKEIKYLVDFKVNKGKQ
ncbi:MAG: hypothetical protein XD41_1166 [Desulfonauticus sp. 38_4375]|nr:MAG: hypothetical protein XD41_1166 [Desulfonauticus sp. 38_4375]